MMIQKRAHLSVSVLSPQMPDAPNHILKIKYDVMERPAVIYMTKFICISTSYTLHMLYIFGYPVID